VETILLFASCLVPLVPGHRRFQDAFGARAALEGLFGAWAGILASAFSGAAPGGPPSKE
jgi:hypothetical protein